MGEFREGGEAPPRGLTRPLLRQNEKVAFVSAVAGRSLSQFARVNRGFGRAGCRPLGVEFSLKSLLGRSGGALGAHFASFWRFLALLVLSSVAFRPPGVPRRPPRRDFGQKMIGS